MLDMTNQQLKLLKYLYKKPRTVRWIKKKFKVDTFRDIASGIFTLVHSTDGRYPDDCIVSISKAGIIEVESRQWFNWQFVLLQILLPIVIAIITTLLTITLTIYLTPSP